MQLFLRNTLVGAAYAAIGSISVMIGGMTQFVVPIWIPAGLAIAALICWGNRMTPGVFIGSAITNIAQFSQLVDHADTAHLVSSSLGVATGVTLGAFVGATLGRRILRSDPALSRWNSAVVFSLLIGPVSAWVSACIGTASIVIAGGIGDEHAIDFVVSWWGGNALGALLMTPVFMVLFGIDDNHWRASGRRVVSALILVTSVIAFMNVFAFRSESARSQTEFETRSHKITERIRANWLQTDTFLRSMERFVTVNGGITKATARQFSRQAVTNLVGVEATGYVSLVTNENRAQFERAHIADMPIGITQATPTGDIVRAGTRPEYAPITYIVSNTPTPLQYGFDLLSNPIRSAALINSISSRSVTVSGAAPLLTGNRGVGAYIAIYPIVGNTQPRSLSTLQGFAAASINIHRLITQSQRINTDDMSVIARDLSAPSSNRLLDVITNPAVHVPTAFAKNTRARTLNASAPYTNIDTINVGGRMWQLEYVPTDSYLAGAFSVVDGLLLAAGLIIGVATTSLILFVNGYTASIESEVDRRVRDLKVSRAHITHILDTTQEAFVSIDRRGRIHDWNPQAVATFGWTKQEAIGSELADLIVPERYREQHRHAISYFDMADEHPLIGKRIELPVLHRDGHEIPTEMSISYLPDHGEYTFHAFLYDITERKAAELERQHAADLKTQFVAMASHEMRTPLTSIIGYAQTLVHRWDTLADDDKRSFVQIIADQGERFSQLIEDLLMITQIEDGKLQARPEHANIRAVAELACADTQINVQFECDPELHALVSQNHLRQIVVNYLRNAEKYGQTPVIIRATQSGSTVNVEVEDAGAGVDPDFVPHLFERFSQEKKRGIGMAQGVGLGLSIVEALARTYGGAAWYRPRLPHGSIFGVTLPASEGPAAS